VGKIDQIVIFENIKDEFKKNISFEWSLESTTDQITDGVARN